MKLTFEKFFPSLKLPTKYKYLFILGSVFYNPICSAALCLIPHFVAVFVRYKMWLVAQFEGFFLDYFFIFFRGKHFLCQTELSFSNRMSKRNFEIYLRSHFVKVPFLYTLN